MAIVVMASCLQCQTVLALVLKSDVANDAQGWHTPTLNPSTASTVEPPGMTTECSLGIGLGTRCSRNMST
jgi:hypothetical protein